MHPRLRAQSMLHDSNIDEGLGPLGRVDFTTESFMLPSRVQKKCQQCRLAGKVKVNGKIHVHGERFGCYASSALRRSPAAKTPLLYGGLHCARQTLPRQISPPTP
eukprot:2287551-Amphidinium_carterae.1